MSGSQAACLAPWIWSAMTPRLRSVMLYDVSPKARARIFPEALRRSSVAGVAWDDGELAAVSWIEPLFPEARCGVIHFCFMRPKRAERIARKFLALVAESRRFDTLMAFLPALYRHARAFAKRVGFEELGVFAGACRLAEPERVAGGALLRLEFGN